MTDLNITFGRGGAQTTVVADGALTVRRGQVTGLVGESGSGKTMMAMAIVGMIPSLGGRITRGSIVFDGVEMLSASEADWRATRGRRIGMIFQQPTRSLNPAFTVGEQISEVLRYHHGLTRREAWRRAVELLDRVRIPQASRRAHDYPHMFSGGMCQRAMIAIALACEPELLVADEPTTALDVTVQAAILELIREIQHETNISVLYISHDFGVIHELCDWVEVMYAGQTIESAPAAGMFTDPQHPYTYSLLRAAAPGRREGRFFALEGRVPAPHERTPEGCVFRSRCAWKEPECATGVMRLEHVDAPGRSACRRVGTIAPELRIGP